MKKDARHVIKRAENFQVILVVEGLLVGVVGGGVVLAYRLLLEYAGEWLQEILAFARKSTWTIAMWFAVLVVLAFVVSLLVKWEPLISGSGIPQLEGEMTGKMEQCWWRVLVAKFTGGFLSLLAGLSLGREGPSIQLGAMVGKGISQLLDRDKTEEKFLLTCGASAGLSAAFHAPLAGVMFSLEEVHKTFSVSVLVSVMTSSITADYLSSHILGLSPVFQFGIVGDLPQKYYWMLVLLGILLGILGMVYNSAILKTQDLYRKPKFLQNPTARIMVPFLLAGVIGFTAPSLLGSGYGLVEQLTDGKMVITTVLLVLLAKFLFSVVSFGSGAPGGIFFPLLVLGALIGGAFAMAAVRYLGLDPEYINNFVLLAMAGYFTAIVRAPLTGIILIFEMTGSVSQMLSLSVISIVAYVTANLLKSKPIYESLLERQLKRKGEEEIHASGQKILSEFVVMHGSMLEERLVQDVQWPDNCLLISLQRSGKEIIPKGKTRLMASDLIVTMTDDANQGVVCDKMYKLCSEQK